MKSVKETVKIRVCKGGSWERVDGVLEYMPLNWVKRTLILPLLPSYSCLLEAVFERLEIDANSGFMVTYNSDNDIVEVCDDLEVNEFMKFVVKSSRIVTLCIVESSVNEEGNESDEEGSETTPVENKNCKEDKFWNMPPLLKTPVLDIKKKGEFLGTMYLAVAMDGSNQILPLAYRVGNSETFKSWDWFLTKLKECIIGKQDHLTIIFDGDVFIASAIKNVFPNAFHGRCRHLLMNLREKCPRFIMPLINLIRVVLKSGQEFTSPHWIIPSRASILQLAQLRKISEIREGGHNDEMSTQEYVKRITEEASEDDHFTRGPWLSMVPYLVVEGSIATGCFGDMKTFIKNGKVEKVVAAIKSCTPNMLGDLTLTLKDISGMIFGTIHHKVLKEEVYGMAIDVFHKDTSAVNSGSSTSRASYWAEEI
ncbi:putative reverse transcriptase domain-containing protein [Tanacetum coccineum]